MLAPLSPDRLRRYRQVVEVLARHGFGALLHELHLEQGLDVPRRLLRRPAPATIGLTPPVRLRLALEELGPTFIKLGQVLSTRPDLLPPSAIAELAKLQDKAPRVPWDAVRETIEAELGQTVDTAFAAFDPAPIATASLGQVHAATRRDGVVVVVKVLRPGVRREIERDIDVLFDLARLIQARARAYLFTDLVTVVDEFAIALRAELDYLSEARNIDRYRDNFAAVPHIAIPRAYRDQTTRRVLVMERLDGIKIDDLDALKAAGADARRVAERLTHFFLKSILEDGFFHADPHPGNFLIQPGDRIAVLDFGRVGRLGHADQIQLARLAGDIVRLDARGTADGLLALTVPSGPTDSMTLERDLRRLLAKYEGLPLEEIRLGPVFQEALDVAHRHHLSVPGHWALLIHTLAVSEGVGARLAPDLNVFQVARPYLLRLQVRMWSPRSWGPDALRTGEDWLRLAQALPRLSLQLLNLVERGQLSLEVRPGAVDPILQRADRIANRLTIAIIMAALILGIAWVIPHVEFAWPGRPAQWLAILGFVGVFGLGLWLVWRMWRGD